MAARVGIIGMGWVGSSVASSLLQSGVASELLLADTKPGLAEGEALDLGHGASFYPNATVRAASVEEMVDLDAVVVAAGRGGKPGQSRLDLLRDNVGLTREIAQALRGLEGLLVMVTNPVDVLTQVAAEASGLPPSRVLGTGTMLDTARLRQVLGRELSLEPRSIHAQVIGEHGDSAVVLWSGASIGGVSLRDWAGWTSEREDEIGTEVRTAAQSIIVRKGATNHAIGLVTARLLRWALRGERRVLTVSRVQTGACGVDGVALSLPAIVGRDGVQAVLQPRMDAAELEGLRRSAEVLREAHARAVG
ncbi:MAG: lactate/malate family dehydrogenase [Nannocystaceae bacterium]|nr:L-lactate dehydrogenase [bacterium]